MRKVLIILGATASGKSGLAVELAKRFNGEVISCDSVQVYKGFNIGSAKVTKAEMGGVPHHLIDICEANDYFTASDFVRCAKQKIEEISRRGRLPIMVGGTGLYINALLNNYNFGDTEKHEEFRKNIERKIETEGFEIVLQSLKEISPEMAEKVMLNNKTRLIRAMEIATFGKAQEKSAISNYDYKIIALNSDRTLLYERINVRTKQMIKSGLVEEVKSLLKAGAKEDSQPMRAIGYKETLQYLKGEIDEKRMEELIAQHTRNYAKRQLTYLRGLDKTCKVEYVDFAKDKEKLTKDIKEWLC